MLQETVWLHLISIYLSKLEKICKNNRGENDKAKFSEEITVFDKVSQIFE